MDTIKEIGFTFLIVGGYAFCGWLTYVLGKATCAYTVILKAWRTRKELERSELIDGWNAYARYGGELNGLDPLFTFLWPFGLIGCILTVLFMTPYAMYKRWWTYKVKPGQFTLRPRWWSVDTLLHNINKKIK